MAKIDDLKDVLDNREDGYGGSKHTLNNIALLWNAYFRVKGVLGAGIAGEDVAEMMVLFKIARSTDKYTTSAHDDRLDIAGYGILAAELAESREVF